MKRKAHVLEKETQLSSPIFRQPCIVQHLYIHAITSRKVLHNLWVVAQHVGVSPSQNRQALCAALKTHLQHTIHFTRNPTFAETKQWLPRYLWEHQDSNRWTYNYYIFNAACQYGDVDILEGWYTTFKPEIKEEARWNGLQLAIKHNQLAIVSWLIRTFAWSKQNILYHAEAIFNSIMQFGRLSILKQLDEHFKFSGADLTPWMEKGAQKITHFHRTLLLEWMRTHTQWKEVFKQGSIIFSLLLGAAGHLETFKLVCMQCNVKKKDILRRNLHLWRGAARQGHLNVMKYIHERYKLTRKQAHIRNNEVALAAFQNGHVHVLRWLHSVPTFSLTAEIMRENDCHFLREAVKRNHIEAVIWCITTFEFTHQDIECKQHDILHMCAREGFTSLLENIHKHIPWTKEDICRFKCNVLFQAAKKNHVETVQWFCETFALTHLELVDQCQNSILQEITKLKHWTIVLYIMHRCSYQSEPSTSSVSFFQSSAIKT